MAPCLAASRPASSVSAQGESKVQSPREGAEDLVSEVLVCAVVDRASDHVSDG